MIRLATLAIALVLIACVPATSAPSSSASGSVPPSSSAAPATSVCRDIEIHQPNGEALDLSGTWLGDSGTYWTFAQVGDCIWATALDHYLIPGDTRDYWWQWFIRGTLLPNFTVSAEYAASQLIAGRQERGTPGHGHTILVIEFEESLSLRKEDECVVDGSPPCPPGEIGLQTSSWTLISSTVILPQPTPGP